MCLIDFYYSYSDKGYILNLIKDRRVCNKLKYGNEINSIEFFDFTAQDFNLFFTICWHIKQKKSKKIAISFDELKEFMPDIKNNRRFYNEICKFARKLTKIIINIRYNNSLNTEEKMNGGLFVTKTETSLDKKEINIVIGNLTYQTLFNFNYFTKFDLNEFCSIQNKYTKTLFRLLKQYENVNENPASGLKNIVMEKQEFLEFMNCPEKYKDKMIFTDRKILIPAIDELNKTSQSFENVSYQKIKEGGVIKKFEISFQTIR